MTVAVVDIGSSSTVVGGAVTITVGAGGVPAQAFVFVVASWNANANTPTIADTAANTYAITGSTQANNSTAALGACGIFRERTGLALSNGNTIVFTLTSGSTTAAVDAFYVAGLENIGSDTFNKNSGSSANPSVSGSGSLMGDEFYVAIVSGSSLVTSFTQDSTNAAWASPPGQVSIAAPVLGGGTIQSTGATGFTYAPTFGTSDSWAAIMASYYVKRPQISVDMGIDALTPLRIQSIPYH